MRILVADDSAGWRNQLRDVLVHSGYEVVLATDGEQAWESLKEGRIPLAILDDQMPRATGLEVCRRLHSRALAQSVYVLMLTTGETADDITAAIDAGANDYLAKPFKKVELLTRVQTGCRVVELQNRLSHAQRLRSIGELASGVAHEINTPLQYIGENTRFLQDVFQKLGNVLAEYDRLRQAILTGTVPLDLLQKVQQSVQEADLDFLLTETPAAIGQTLEGVEQVVKIVRSLRDFAHPGNGEVQPTDLHRAILNALSVARNEWNRVAEVATDFDENLPQIPCLAGEINQAMLNLIVNAAHAVATRRQKEQDHPGRITIRTRIRNDWAEVEVEDNGCGIAPEHRSRVFDPFFTTKELGKGTGQGLMIARSVIVEKHGGTIHFETEVDRGTTFVLRLPVGQQQAGMDRPSESQLLVETGAGSD